MPHDAWARIKAIRHSEAARKGAHHRQYAHGHIGHELSQAADRQTGAVRARFTKLTALERHKPIHPGRGAHATKHHVESHDTPFGTSGVKRTVTSVQDVRRTTAKLYGGKSSVPLGKGRIRGRDLTTAGFAYSRDQIANGLTDTVGNPNDGSMRYAHPRGVAGNLLALEVPGPADENDVPREGQRSVPLQRLQFLEATLSVLKDIPQTDASQTEAFANILQSYNLGRNRNTQDTQSTMEYRVVTRADLPSGAEFVLLQRAVDFVSLHPQADGHVSFLDINPGVGIRQLCAALAGRRITDYYALALNPTGEDNPARSGEIMRGIRASNFKLVKESLQLPEGWGDGVLRSDCSPKAGDKASASAYFRCMLTTDTSKGVPSIIQITSDRGKRDDPRFAKIETLTIETLRRAVKALYANAFVKGQNGIAFLVVHLGFPIQEIIADKAAHWLVDFSKTRVDVGKASFLLVRPFTKHLLVVVGVSVSSKGGVATAQESAEAFLGTMRFIKQRQYYDERGYQDWFKENTAPGRTGPYADYLRSQLVARKQQPSAARMYREPAEETKHNGADSSSSSSSSSSAFSSSSSTAFSTSGIATSIHATESTLRRAFVAAVTKKLAKLFSRLYPARDAASLAPVVEAHAIWERRLWEERVKVLGASDEKALAAADEVFWYVRQFVLDSKERAQEVLVEIYGPGRSSYIRLQLVLVEIRLYLFLRLINPLLRDRKTGLFEYLTKEVSVSDAKLLCETMQLSTTGMLKRDGPALKAMVTKNIVAQLEANDARGNADRQKLRGSDGVLGSMRAADRLAAVKEERTWGAHLLF